MYNYQGKPEKKATTSERKAAKGCNFFGIATTDMKAQGKAEKAYKSNL